jgi:hypothetical protein
MAMAAFASGLFQKSARVGFILNLQKYDVVSSGFSH